RVDQAGARPALQPDVQKFIAANDRPDTFDSFTVVAVDTASNVYVVWSERRPDKQTTDTMLAVSKDRGQTWTEPIKVNRAPQTTTFPWIVAGDAGKIDIVYYGTNEKGPSPETVPPTSKWRVWMAQSLNALDPKPTFKEHPATNFMHQGAICTSGTGCAPGTRDLLDFFQLDVDAQGMANIAYTDNLNTPPDGTDPHQEWVTFVQQKGGKGLFD
ncbi:MAG TPA: sialidase family protein, partial [Actinomycetota bacterium]|nr:sialidase family protein [Actinomycetota bacterium]